MTLPPALAKRPAESDIKEFEGAESSSILHAERYRLRSSLFRGCPRKPVRNHAGNGSKGYPGHEQFNLSGRRDLEPHQESAPVGGLTPD